MYDQATRHRAMNLIAEGRSFLDVSLTMGVSQRALRDWWSNPEKLSLSSKRTCPRCSEVRTLVEPQRDYAYLLGLYLGDGYISRPRASKDVPGGNTSAKSSSSRGSRRSLSGIPGISLAASSIRTAAGSSTGFGAR